MMATSISQFTELKPVKTFKKSASDKAVEYDGYLLAHKDAIQSRYILKEINSVANYVFVDMIG